MPTQSMFVSRRRQTGRQRPHYTLDVSATKRVNKTLTPYTSEPILMQLDTRQGNETISCECQQVNSQDHTRLKTDLDAWRMHYSLCSSSRTPNRTSNLATLSQLHWLPIHDRIKFKIATMTHKAIYTCNSPYLANLVQWHTPSRNLRSASANRLSVTRCNISFGARGFRSAAPAIWNSLPSNVRSCETLTSADTSNLIFSIQPLPLPSDPSQRL